MYNTELTEFINVSSSSRSITTEVLAEYQLIDRRALDKAGPCSQKKKKINKKS